MQAIWLIWYYIINLPLSQNPTKTCNLSNRLKSFFLGTTFSTHFNHVPLRENNNQTQSFHGKEGKGITEILAYNSDASSNKGYGRVSQGLVILCVFVACASLFLFHTRQDLPCSNLNKEEVYIGKSTVKSQSKDQPFFSFNGNDHPLSSPHNDGIYIFITWDYWKIEGILNYLTIVVWWKL